VHEDEVCAHVLTHKDVWCYVTHLALQHLTDVVTHEQSAWVWRSNKVSRKMSSEKHLEERGRGVRMGWLRLVGSLKSQVSFAEYSLFYRALLQKRPIILRSLLIIATPYAYRMQDSVQTMCDLEQCTHLWYSTHLKSSEMNERWIMREFVSRLINCLGVCSRIFSCTKEEIEEFAPTIQTNWSRVRKLFGAQS